ncbi:MAG: hypothetical protein KDE30_05775, partial [Novosphingobium sp.]|nr:hypothetical protein [Novosphingobium sp.]
MDRRPPRSIPPWRIITRFWYRAPVQTKFLLITVPLAMIMTVGGHAIRQYQTGQRAIEIAVQQFDEVGKRAAAALATEYWNYNVTQAGAIMRSLMLIPKVVRAASVEVANGNVVADSPFRFEAVNASPGSTDRLGWYRAEFPILANRGSAAPETVGMLTIDYSLAEQESENQRIFLRTVLNASAGALLLILGVTFAMNRSIIRPIEWVSASARQSD